MNNSPALNFAKTFDVIGLQAALTASTLDAIVAPATAPAWLIDPVNGDHFLGEGYGAGSLQEADLGHLAAFEALGQRRHRRNVDDGRVAGDDVGR